jgi:hypothetical protein
VSGKAKNVMTQSQWVDWARLRPQEGRRLEKLYERQGAAVLKMVSEHGCICNPIIVLPQGGDGPTTANPLLTHAFDCERG